MSLTKVLYDFAGSFIDASFKGSGWARKWNRQENYSWPIQ